MMQKNIQSAVVMAVLFIAMVLVSGCMTTKSKASYGGAVGSNDQPCGQKAL